MLDFNNHDCKPFTGHYKKGNKMGKVNLKKCKEIIKGETGGPNLEAVLAIFVALSFVIAIGGLGATIIIWINNTVNNIESLTSVYYPALQVLSNVFR